MLKDYKGNGSKAVALYKRVAEPVRCLVSLCMLRMVPLSLIVTLAAFARPRSNCDCIGVLLPILSRLCNTPHALLDIIIRLPRLVHRNICKGATITGQDMIWPSLRACSICSRPKGTHLEHYSLGSIHLQASACFSLPDRGLSFSSPTFLRAFRVSLFWQKVPHILSITIWVILLVLCTTHYLFCAFTCSPMKMRFSLPLRYAGYSFDTYPIRRLRQSTTRSTCSA